MAWRAVHVWRRLPSWSESRAATLNSRRRGSGNSCAALYSSSSAAAGAPPELQPSSALALKANAVPLVHHPLYSAPQLGPRHRFPMGVFQVIFETLLGEGLVSPQQVFTPPQLPSQATLERVHDAGYMQQFLSGSLDEQAMRRIGFGEVVRSQTLIDRTLAEVAGTLLTAQLALEHGLACNTAGGTHHAFRGRGSGFCIINDLAVTAESLLAAGRVQRVLILDLDVHQGDGTASIFEGRQDVFTLSVHAESNFPARKQRSHLDIGLPDGTGDEAYLGRVGEVLPHIVSTFRPDLVLYDAGVDPHAEDELGRLALSDEGLARREMLVLDTCLAHGLPVAGYVGGGYHRDLQLLARRHTLLHRAADELWHSRSL